MVNLLSSFACRETMHYFFYVFLKNESTNKTTRNLRNYENNLQIENSKNLEKRQRYRFSIDKRCEKLCRYNSLVLNH